MEVVEYKISYWETGYLPYPQDAYKITLPDGSYQLLRKYISDIVLENISFDSDLMTIKLTIEKQ